MNDYRYFAHPHDSTASTWSAEPQTCGICGETRTGYEGPYYGHEDVEFVCEPCLSGGRLVEKGLTTNNGDVGPAHDRREELERRTPLLVSWQDLSWPVHCGDFCRFEREVGQRELEELAAGDGAAFFRKHLHPDLRDTDLDWEDVPPRGPASRTDSNSPTVYLFRCLGCAEPILWWDVD